jgi:hypothetical protein
MSLWEWETAVSGLSSSPLSAKTPRQPEVERIIPRRAFSVSRFMGAQYNLNPFLLLEEFRLFRELHKIFEKGTIKPRNLSILVI